MKIKLSVSLVLALLLCAQAVAAVTPELVDAEWLAKHRDRPGLVILDVQEAEPFMRHHLSGAVNLPYSRWRSGPESPVPGSLLSVAQYETLLGKAGIRNDQHLVVMSTGLQPGDLSATARVFWTLRLLGHARVSLLDGGLAAYAKLLSEPLMRGRAEARPVATYQATPDMTLLASADDMQNADLRIDARSPEEFLGLMSGGEDERPGTIPGSRNLPYSWLSEQAASGKLREARALETLFDKAGIDDQDGGVHFCHTGNRASLTWFVDYAVRGNRNARLYDASMLEWARDQARPVDRQWDL